MSRTPGGRLPRSDVVHERLAIFLQFLHTYLYNITDADNADENTLIDDWNMSNAMVCHRRH